MPDKTVNPLRIDVHAHMVSAREDLGAFIAPGALQRRSLRAAADARHKFPPLNRFLQNNFDDWYIKNIVRKIKQSKLIDRAVLLAFDAIYLPDGGMDREKTFACTPNDIVRRAADEHPGELLWGASINPSRPDAIAELERCASLGTVLVKWVPNAQNIDPADKRIIPFYDKMAALRLPMLSHTGYEHALRAHDQSLGDPRRLSLPLERGVTVIAAHAGASGTHDPVEYFGFFLEMLKQHKNLFGDLAALTWTNRKYYLMHMVRNPELFDRMVQGTDYPVPVVPAIFARELGLARSLAAQFANYFDAEARLKLELGVPESVFARAASLLPISNSTAAAQI